LISEWRPADFGGIGIFELTLLAGIGLALLRGVRLPPMRIALLLGLVHMALSQSRAAEMLALVAPLVLAEPLARQIGGTDASGSRNSPPMRGALVAGIIVARSRERWPTSPSTAMNRTMRGTPVAAVAELKTLNLARVFNDYDFGGYLIASGVPTFIDGRTELFGETFFVDHNNASGLMEPEKPVSVCSTRTRSRRPCCGRRVLRPSCSITSTAGRRSIPTASQRYISVSSVRWHTREPAVDVTASKPEQKAD